jgi:excisionase family DNA binding protein
MSRPVGGSVKISLDRVALVPERGTANEIAKIIGVSATTLRQWCLIGKLPNTVVGRVYMIEKKELEQWLIATGRV